MSNWYKFAQSSVYWIPAQQSLQLQVGQVLPQTRVFDSRRRAESEADTSYTENPRAGAPTVYPCRLRGAKVQGFGFQRQIIGEATIVGPAELTEKGKLSTHQEQYICLFELDASTSGWHGRGDEDDVPADDPREHVTWTPRVPLQTIQQLLPIIKGQKVAVTSRHDGSFHEQWFHATVSVAVPEDRVYLIEDHHPEVSMSSLSRIAGKQKYVGSFPFTDVHDMAEQAMKLLECAAPPQINHRTDGWYHPTNAAPVIQPTPDINQPKPGMTPEQHYQRLIDLSKTKMNRPLSGD